MGAAPFASVVQLYPCDVVTVNGAPMRSLQEDLESKRKHVTSCGETDWDVRPSEEGCQSRRSLMIIKE